MASAEDDADKDDEDDVDGEHEAAAAVEANVLLRNLITKLFAVCRYFDTVFGCLFTLRKVQAS